MIKNNFIRGMVNINLFPRERNVNISLPTETDTNAMKKDLEAVGTDMWAAIKVIDRKIASSDSSNIKQEREVSCHKKNKCPKEK